MPIHLDVHSLISDFSTLKSAVWCPTLCALPAALCHRACAQAKQTRTSAKARRRVIAGNSRLRLIFGAFDPL